VVIVNTRYFTYAFGFLVFASFVDKGNSEVLKPSLMIRCEYTECTDIMWGRPCSPRTKPVQFFDFFNSSRTIIEDKTGTNNIISEKKHEVSFGRTYQKDLNRIRFIKTIDRYNFNRETFGIIKRTKVFEFVKDGDIDYQADAGISDSHIVYKGKCSPITTEEHY